ncbi:hypothetical protein [Leptospira levettii]|uniref:hypothetical protein n=1 Tax=Leptospira levettii TaxID=2023178 RepID=UPI000C2A1EC1|nr:hypothetical protein [Leptospira levettii]PJZ89543.1 hypothetical protein CH368_06185 [Leptospira levettii]
MSNSNFGGYFEDIPFRIPFGKQNGKPNRPFEPDLTPRPPAKRLVRDFSNKNKNIRLEIYHPMERSPFIIQDGQIASVNSTRSIDGNNQISLDFRGGTVFLDRLLPGTGTLDTSNRLEISPLLAFPDGGIVILKINAGNDNFRQLNLGYIDQNDFRLSPSDMGFSLVIPGIEKRIMQNKFFIDQIRPKEEAIESQLYDAPLLSNADLLVAFSEIASKFQDLKPLLNSIWDKLIYRTNRVNRLNGTPFSYGGLPLLSKSDDVSDGGFLRFQQPYNESYTSNFLNVFQYLQQATNVGSQIDFWEILSSYATPPLYELFCDPLEGDSVLRGESGYTVDKNSASLVFRKTPLDKMFDADGEWTFEEEEHYLINPAELLDYKVSRSFGNVYSGVHVGMNSIGEFLNLALVKPSWDNVLRAIYGLKLLPVKLPGFPYLEPKEAKRKDNMDSTKTRLKEIQDRLQKIFVNHKSMKHLTGTFTVPFTLFRVGTPFKNSLMSFGENRLNTSLERESSDFPLTGYITGVNDRISIDDKTADTTVQFKWATEPYLNQNVGLGLLDQKVAIRDEDLALFEFRRL